MLGLEGRGSSALKINYLPYGRFDHRFYEVYMLKTTSQCYKGSILETEVKQWHLEHTRCHCSTM